MSAASSPPKEPEIRQRRRHCLQSIPRRGRLLWDIIHSIIRFLCLARQKPQKNCIASSEMYLSNNFLLLLTYARTRVLPILDTQLNIKVTWFLARKRDFLLANECINEGGLPDIGSPNDGKFRAVVSGAISNPGAAPHEFHLLDLCFTGVRFNNDVRARENHLLGNLF